MPWAKHSYERTVEVYKEMLPLFPNKYDNVELVAKELLIRGELLKHDFTKRQLVILMTIITFSFNYGKDVAYIPKLSDFEIAGIQRSKIKSELQKLVDMNVIEWNTETNEYKIQEPKYWKNCPFNYGYNDDRSRQLFFLNLKHAGIDITPIVEKLRELES